MDLRRIIVINLMMNFCKQPNGNIVNSKVICGLSRINGHPYVFILLSRIFSFTTQMSNNLARTLLIHLRFPVTVV